MKFKLDENLGLRAQELFRAAGHDALLVREQGLGGAADQAIFDICVGEGRALVSLDHDFAQVLRFPPNRSAGIIILEVPRRPHPDAVLRRVAEFLRFLEEHPLGRELWIVEPGRVRLHQQRED